LFVNTDTKKSQTNTSAAPTARFLFAHPAHWIAQGLGSGLTRLMPGTSGTLFGWLIFHVFSLRWPQLFTPGAWALTILVGLLIGVWACAKTGRDLGIADHGSMVWDEIVAFWIVLLFLMPASFMTQLAAFLLFRAFDMMKPPPISTIDRRVKGGIGVMADDVVAAFYTLLVIALWRTI
jgi:phosphatidylglycerophosphatase A